MARAGIEPATSQMAQKRPYRWEIKTSQKLFLQTFFR